MYLIENDDTKVFVAIFLLVPQIVVMSYAFSISFVCKQF